MINIQDAEKLLREALNDKATLPFNWPKEECRCALVALAHKKEAEDSEVRICTVSDIAVNFYGFTFNQAWTIMSGWDGLESNGKPKYSDEYFNPAQDKEFWDLGRKLALEYRGY